jgi:hypothetical protein
METPMERSPLDGVVEAYKVGFLALIGYLIYDFIFTRLMKSIFKTIYGVEINKRGEVINQDNANSDGNRKTVIKGLYWLLWWVLLVPSFSIFIMLFKFWIVG